MSTVPRSMESALNARTQRTPKRVQNPLQDHHLPTRRRRIVFRNTTGPIARLPHHPRHPQENVSYWEANAKDRTTTSVAEARLVPAMNQVGQDLDTSVQGRQWSNRQRTRRPDPRATLSIVTIKISALRPTIRKAVEWAGRGQATAMMLATLSAAS